MFHDAMPIRGIGKFESKNLCVFLSLLQAVAGVLVSGFCFHYCNRKVASVPEEIIRTFLGAAQWSFPGNHNAPVRERALFVYLLVAPSGRIELRQNVFSTGI